MSGTTGEAGIKLIKIFEGFRERAYLCPAGFWTIGYGHKLKSYTSDIIDQGEAEILLKQDLRIAESGVDRYIKVALKHNQFDALVSFTYNCGTAALQRSTLRQKINYLSFEEARGEFMRWTYSNGVRLPGLVKRRSAESAMFAGSLSDSLGP
jgi:lysozyme